MVLLQFDAQKVDKTIHLSWSTSTEQNNLGFETERSADGLLWYKIGWHASDAQQGSGSHLTSYTFTDKSPLPGKNYYRLKQLDLNGEAHYSEVKAVLFADRLHFEVSPNPATDVISIRGIKEGERVYISNIWGETLRAHSSQNSSDLTFDVRNFPTGNYVITVANAGGRIGQLKFAKE